MEGTNPAYTSHELAHSIRTAKIRFMIIEPDAKMVQNAMEAAKECGIPLCNLFLFDIHGQKAPNVPDADQLRSWNWLLSQGESDWERFDDRHTSETTPAARLFSSGTTGLPKALDMTHYNFIAQHTVIIEYKPRPYPIRRLLCNPLFHVSQVPRAHTSSLRAGITTYVMRRFELEPWLRNMERFEITEVNMVRPHPVFRIIDRITQE